MNLLGIDIGGTKTAVCVGDEAGNILISARFPTPHDAAPFCEWLIAQCRAVIAGAGLTLHEVGAAGISAPGPLSVAHGMILAPPNNPGIVDLPIVQRVRDALGLPAYFNNDANAAALAEWYFGAYRGTPNLVYLTFSTGMGGGVIAGGRLLQGASDAGGEFGHMIVELNSPVVNGKKTGSLEHYVGGREVTARTKARIREGNIRTAIVDKAGGSVEAITMRAITDAYREGDPFAREVWGEVMERLAQGLGIVIMTCNPEVILLGTMAIRERDIVLPEIEKRLPAYGWDVSLASCKIDVSSLGDRIGEMAGLAVAVCGVRGV